MSARRQQESADSFSAPFWPRVLGVSCGAASVRVAGAILVSIPLLHGAQWMTESIVRGLQFVPAPGGSAEPLAAVVAVNATPAKYGLLAAIGALVFRAGQRALALLATYVLVEFLLTSAEYWALWVLWPGPLSFPLRFLFFHLLEHMAMPVAMLVWYLRYVPPAQGAVERQTEPSANLWRSLSFFAILGLAVSSTLEARAAYELFFSWGWTGVAPGGVRELDLLTYLLACFVPPALVVTAVCARTLRRWPSVAVLVTGLTIVSVVVSAWRRVAFASSAGILAFVFGSSTVPVVLIMLVGFARIYDVIKQCEDVFCSHCGYVVAMIEADRCPECGAPVTRQTELSGGNRNGQK